MKEKEFQLLDEPWIRVIDRNCEIHELSLLETFERAGEYTDLCGELPVQDVAVMRFMLAVLHTVLPRYYPSGSERENFEDSDEALDCWQEIWGNRKFPMDIIRKYLESQRESLWLFHPEKPFWQTPKASIGTEYGAAKLNGELSESSNKTRLFQSSSGESKNVMTYSQAARWLLYMNGFDDTSSKPTSEGKKKYGKLLSPGAGWLGKLGLITLQGENLFETLMLNLVLLDSNGDIYPPPTPVWELTEMPSRERQEITVPNNLAALYTLQSRRLLLKRSDEGVVGYSLLGGDFFISENAFIEPMTIWTGTRNKKTKKYEPPYKPRRHNKSRQFWREFSSVYPATDDAEGHHQPGVLTWYSMLQNSDCISERRMLKTKIMSVQYGDKDFFVSNTYSDKLTMHDEIMTEYNGEWRSMIIGAIKKCDTISMHIRNLANDIFIASGGDEIKNDYAEAAQAEYYRLIDISFREWLSGLDPSEQLAEDMAKEWKRKAIDIAERYAKKLADKAGLQAFAGKEIKLNDKSASRYYSVPLALNMFDAKMYKIKQEVK